MVIGGRELHPPPLRPTGFIAMRVPKPRPRSWVQSVTKYPGVGTTYKGFGLDKSPF